MSKTRKTRKTAVAAALLAAMVMLPVVPARAGATAATPADAARIKRLIIEEAELTTVPPSLALAVARVESGFRAGAESTAGARGVMQIMPATARGEYGIAAAELWDPRLNVQLGIHYLESLIERYGGRWDLALSHYNGGSLQGSGATARPHGYTRGYVDAVLKWQQRYAERARVWRDARLRPEDGWRPARTKVAWSEAAPTPAMARPPAPPPAQPRGALAAAAPAAVAAPEKPVRVLVWHGPAAADRPALDDFASGRVQRILRERGVRPLGDLAPVVRWWQG